MDLAHQLLKLGAPGDALPTYLTADEDLDYDEVSPGKITPVGFRGFRQVFV